MKSPFTFLTTLRAWRSALLSICIANAIPILSHAQDRPRLPDGRILVEIKGSKIALPSEGADVQDIRFNGTTLTLDKVLRSPHEANEYFNANKLLYVSIPNVPGRRGLYLNRFDREVFREFSASVSFGENSQGNCRGWARNYEALLAEAAKDGTRAAPDGWFEFINRKSPITYIYIYIRPETSPHLPKFFNSFSCDTFQNCASSSCIGSDIGFTYNFSLRNNPRADWPQTMQRAAEVLRFVLPEIQDLAEGK